MAVKLTESLWQAIVDCDPSYDGAFLYGVSTTGIFCRPSCKSRTPARDNVLIFRDAKEAESLHYRPCKRCRPDGRSLPDAEWTSGIAAWMREHLAEPMTLTRLADTFHASPYHLQRVFKKIHGVSPAVWLQRVRMKQAQEWLTDGRMTVSEAASRSGMSSPAQFATLFRKHTGMTPTQYRDRRREEEKHGSDEGA
jgi:AraC family transcriptional regulator of adaptative response / methylphosphotriester-DNA alkyltransferase methyltransferase